MHFVERGSDYRPSDCSSQDGVMQRAAKNVMAAAAEAQVKSPQAEIERELNLLLSTVEAVGAESARLIGRLSPVSESAGVGEAERGGKVEQSVNTPLGQRLYQARGALNGIASMLADARHRLAL